MSDGPAGDASVTEEDHRVVRRWSVLQWRVSGLGAAACIVLGLVLVTTGEAFGFVLLLPATVLGCLALMFRVGVRRLDARAAERGLR